MSVEQALVERARLGALATDISIALTGGRNLLATLRLCTDAMVRHIDAAFARIWTLNDRESVLELQASSGLYTHTDGADSRVPVGSLKVGMIAGQRQTLITEDLSGDPAIDQESARREGVVAFAGYPLVVEDRLVGVMAMSARRPLSGASLQSMASLANAIALGIERFRSEAALRRSERQYRLLFEESPHPMWVFDRSTLAFLAVNNAAVRHFGYSAPEFSRMALPDICPPAEQAGLRERSEQLGDGDSTMIQGTRLRKNGTAVDVEANWSAIAFRSKPAVLALVIDVTERRQAQEALRRSEDQLRQANKMQAIGRLAGGVAHDFNNLLTAITGHAQFILEDLPAGSPLREDAEVIRATADRASSLTRQLLVFSRRQVLEPKVLDLNSVITETGKMLRRLIGEHIELVTTLAPDLGSIKVDPSQIEQVILNLAINARDAMACGGRLTVETVNADLRRPDDARQVGVPPGHYVLLSVHDNGCGMEAEVQSHIFEPFFTTKEVGKGTGLGLSMVYGIVQQSGGNIGFSSEPGRGTSFRIFLPRVDQVADSAEARKTASAPRPSHPETILVVEDEEDVRVMLHKILSKNGYEVLEARDGREAIALGKKHPGQIDLLLTDVVMPEMSGADLGKRFCEMWPRVRVVYMSGYTDSLIAQMGILKTNAALIMKPFGDKELLGVVRSILDQGAQSKTKTAKVESAA